MQLLKIEVQNLHFGGQQFRVTARSDDGRILIGVSKVFRDKTGPKILQDLVDEMTKTQQSVAHISPLGQE